MTEQLREELHHLGDRTPDLATPPDLWARGRRARTRGRLLTTAAAAVLVAVLAGLVWAVPGSRLLAPADQPEQGGVPSYVETVPGHLQGQDPENRWTGPVESDLALGQGALAFVTGSGLPVLVTADGDYHLLNLPGFLGNARQTALLMQDNVSTVSLSPDGTHLAWAWVTLPGRTDYTPAPSGIRIADLTTGRIREEILTDGRSVAVSALVWSPDSRWLAWRGQAMKQWNESGSAWDGFSFGAVGPGSRRAWGSSSRQEYVGIAIDDQGLVSIAVQGGTVAVWDGEIRVSRSAARGWNVSPRGAVAPDGRRVLFGAWGGDDPRVLEAKGEVTVRRLSPQVYPEGADTEVLGWIDGEHAVVAARERVGDSIGEPHVAIVSVPAGRTSTYRIVTRFGEPEDDMGSVIGQISVAVDLMTLERPTVDPVDQNWPWSTERKVAVAALGLLGVLALGVLILALRRQRSR